MTISTLSSRTSWSRVWCYSSATDRSSMHFALSQMHPSLRMDPTISQSVCTHLVVLSQFSISVATSLLSATSATRKRKFTSFSVLSTANTFVTCKLSPLTHRASSACASCLRICCRLTSQRCVITWICWASTHWRLCSLGFTTRSWTCWRSTSSTTFTIAFWASSRWRSYPFARPVFSLSVPTWSSTVRTRTSSTNCSWISQCWRWRPSCSISSSRPESTENRFQLNRVCNLYWYWYMLLYFTLKLI